MINQHCGMPLISIGETKENKILLIKHVKEIFKMGLKQAKEYVESHDNLMQRIKMYQCVKCEKVFYQRLRMPEEQISERSRVFGFRFVEQLEINFDETRTPQSPDLNRMIILRKDPDKTENAILSITSEGHAFHYEINTHDIGSLLTGEFIKATLL